ncbi:hypothetical protein CCR75_009067 [Bremia lactucae]|uniref:Uncharacterized protein n=1 Tax=Bremia lactucae TaxID=4779 RepID=A0A976IFJ4_BRELC|nr:hypothetical protein CCR75_009067 [Bremia lactucae]
MKVVLSVSDVTTASCKISTSFQPMADSRTLQSNSVSTAWVVYYGCFADLVKNRYKTSFW